MLRKCQLQHMRASAPRTHCEGPNSSVTNPYKKPYSNPFPAHVNSTVVPLISTNKPDDKHVASAFPLPDSRPLDIPAFERATEYVANMPLTYSRGQFKSLPLSILAGRLGTSLFALQGSHPGETVKLAMLGVAGKLKGNTDLISLNLRTADANGAAVIAGSRSRVADIVEEQLGPAGVRNFCTIRATNSTTNGAEVHGHGIPTHTVTIETTSLEDAAKLADHFTHHPCIPIVNYKEFGISNGVPDMRIKQQSGGSGLPEAKLVAIEVAGCNAFAHLKPQQLPAAVLAHNMQYIASRTADVEERAHLLWDFLSSPSGQLLGAEYGVRPFSPDSPYKGRLATAQFPSEAMTRVFAQCFKISLPILGTYDGQIHFTIDPPESLPSMEYGILMCPPSGQAGRPVPALNDLADHMAVRCDRTRHTAYKLVTVHNRMAQQQQQQQLSIPSPREHVKEITLYTSRGDVAIIRGPVEETPASAFVVQLRNGRFCWLHQLPTTATGVNLSEVAAYGLSFTDPHSQALALLNCIEDSPDHDSRIDTSFGPYSLSLPKGSALAPEQEVQWKGQHNPEQPSSHPAAPAFYGAALAHGDDPMATVTSLLSGGPRLTSDGISYLANAACISLRSDTFSLPAHKVVLLPGASPPAVAAEQGPAQGSLLDLALADLLPAFDAAAAPIPSPPNPGPPTSGVKRPHSESDGKDEDGDLGMGGRENED